MDDYQSLVPLDREPRRLPGMWDLLSAVTLIGAIGLGVYMLILFLYPNSPINPLPARNPFAPATFTITPILLGPTWTPTVTPFQTATETRRPTFTPIASATAFSLLPPTKTPTPSKTPKAPYSATVHQLQSDITVPHLSALGCDWQGVGGSVVDSNNSDIVGLVVRLTGFYNDKSVHLTTVSGISPDYGKSGFEFVLGSGPIASKGQLTVQLLDQAGMPLSEQVSLQTFDTCEKNLSLVRFKKNR